MQKSKKGNDKEKKEENLELIIARDVMVYRVVIVTFLTFGLIVRELCGVASRVATCNEATTLWAPMIVGVGLLRVRGVVIGFWWIMLRIGIKLRVVNCRIG